MQIPETKVVYFATTWLEQAYFVRLFDEDGREMGILSEGGTPRAFSREDSAIAFAEGKRLLPFPAHFAKGQR